MGKFEDDLRVALPRGLKGKTDTPPEAVWLNGEELGSEWSYGTGTANERRGVFLGFRHGKAVGWNDDRHVLLIAGSRGGKGRSLIVPNLLFYDGSVLAIDPKGELARVTSRARAENGHKVYVLDPFGASLQDCKSPAQRAALEQRLASFNPLDELDAASDTIVDDAEALAASLIVLGEKDPHWGENARRVVKMLILYAMTQPADVRHLGFVRDLLMLKVDDIGEVATLKNISRDRALFEIVLGQPDPYGGAMHGEAEAFKSLLLTSDKEFGSILSAARTQTSFLDSQSMRKVLAASSFRLRDLKREKVTVFLCLPAGRMATHAKWLRAVIDLALQSAERTPNNPRGTAPLLMVLDEFPVLGHMASIETAAGQIAGYGVKLWTVIQDVSQLKRLYRDSWQTFVGNAGVVLAFANTDGETLDFVSKKLGQVLMDGQKMSGASLSSVTSGAKIISNDRRLAPLLYPHEIESTFGRETRRLLVMTSGNPPLAIERAMYDEPAQPFTGKFDP